MFKKRTFGRNDKLIYSWLPQAEIDLQKDRQESGDSVSRLKEYSHDFFPVDELSYFIAKKKGILDR